MDHDTFTDLLARVRAGEEQAAAEVVRLYEREIRREVRLRLRDSRLRRLFDSMDICQSVLASLFGCLAEGKYQVERPDQLLKLLVGMTRNKLAFQVRKQRAGRRDHRRLEGVELDQLAAAGDSPSCLAEGRDLLEEVRRRLTDLERRLLELRTQGRDWGQIAAELGGTADACRMQYARSLRRLAREFRTEE
jgi:RNA polymerase sigma-70 factor (ECF subfamily)